MRPTTRFLRARSLLCCLALFAVAAGEAAAVPGECPAVFPLEEVQPGIQAEGWTVAQGRMPEPFRVEVLGVLRDGIALGHDMIIVEVSDVPGGTMIERAGGIWAGMSGSPVYVGDRLLGAIAWSFSLGPSPVGGVTPARNMLDVLELGETPGPAGRESVTVPKSLRPLLAQRSGLAESDVATIETLPLAFAVSGLDARHRRTVQSALERAGVSAVVLPTSSALRQRGPISARPLPGGNFVGLLSVGDLSAGAVGTTTYVCGDRALAFGHSFRLLGATSMIAGDAEALTIVTDPTTGPSKLANVEETVGVLDQDRTAAIAATLGVRPRLVRIGSVVEAPELGRKRKGVSWTPAVQLVPDVAALHLLANAQAAFDEQGDGRSRVEWRVRGRRANGEEWVLRRANRYASRFDIAFGAVTDVLNQLARIEANPFEEVSFRRVRMRAKVHSGFRTFRMEALTIWRDGAPLADEGDIEVRAGEALLLEALLRSEDGKPVTRSLALRVPPDAAGRALISVGGGGSFPGLSLGDACLFDHAPCADETGESFEALLDELANAPQNNDLVATLDLLDGIEGGPAAGSSRRFSRVVDGKLQRFANILPAAAP